MQKKPSDDSQPDCDHRCDFDIDRMEKALEGPAYVSPKGLTRDELIAWFNAVGRGEIVPELAPELPPDFDMVALEWAFDCEFVEPPCQTPEEFHDFIMNNNHEDNADDV